MTRRSVCRSAGFGSFFDEQLLTNRTTTLTTIEALTGPHLSSRGSQSQTAKSSSILRAWYSFLTTPVQEACVAEPVIRSISDTARWVATSRTRETERPDPVAAHVTATAQGPKSNLIGRVSAATLLVQ